MKKHRIFILISVAIVLLGLVFAEYYPAIKILVKKQIMISGFIIRRPDGFQILGDRTMLSLQEPMSIHFAQMKNGKERLDDWKQFMEKKGVPSRYETTKVGCKTGICLRTINPDEKDPYEDIKIFVAPDLTIFISMPFDKKNQKREQFLQNFLQQNITCSK